MPLLSSLQDLLIYFNTHKIKTMSDKEKTTTTETETKQTGGEINIKVGSDNMPPVETETVKETTTTKED